MASPKNPLKQRKVWQHPHFYALLFWTQTALLLYMLMIVTALGAHWTELWQDLPRAGIFWLMEALILMGVTLHVESKCKQENHEAHKQHYQQHPEQLLQLLLWQAVEGKLISDQLQALHLDFPVSRTPHGKENERWALYCKNNRNQFLRIWVEASDAQHPKAKEVEPVYGENAKSLFLKLSRELHSELFGEPELW